jgi:hypothetical protein
MFGELDDSVQAKMLEGLQQVQRSEQGYRSRKQYRRREVKNLYKRMQVQSLLAVRDPNNASKGLYKQVDVSALTGINKSRIHQLATSKEKSVFGTVPLSKDNAVIEAVRKGVTKIGLQ